MTKRILTKEDGYAVVMGGTVLGAGGGGPIEGGKKLSTLSTSMGQPTLISLDDLDDDDLVITASAVGAPAAINQFTLPVDALKAMELVQEKLNKPIAGIITNENGPASGVNGWLQSAVMNIPMVDCPANGRAHPTGLMGAMGIHRLPEYNSIQAAVGGNPATGKYLNMTVEGKIEVTANLVRQAAVQADGFVAVVRDPLPVSYLKENAAPGATTQAMNIGHAMINAMDKGASAVISAILESTGGRIFCEGKIQARELTTVGGYDVGNLRVVGTNSVSISFWNEYMTVETDDGQRHATFPDLITVINLDSGIPLQSSDIKDGDNVAVLVVPMSKMILGKGVLLPETIKEAEDATQKELFNFMQ
jgi:DUF917 family protein